MKKSGWALSSTTTCNVSSDSIRPTNSCSSVMVSGSAKFIGGLLNVTRQYPLDTSVIVNWVKKAVIRRIPPFRGAAHRKHQVPSTFGRDNEDDSHHPHCQAPFVMFCSARSGGGESGLWRRWIRSPRQDDAYNRQHQTDVASVGGSVRG